MKLIKSTVSVILALAILLGVGVGAFAADEKEETVFLLGDANVDGTVDITDATLLQRYDARLRLLTFKGENLGDVNRDDYADVIDVTLLQRSLAGMSSAQGIGEPVAPNPMRFENGQSQPIIPLDDVLFDDEVYSNTGMHLITFTVYVETDYDTDLDGKPDLVKAWVKLPRPAAEGDYQASVIYQANPYSAGRDEEADIPLADDRLDTAALSTTPEKRVPAGTASLEQVSADAKESDWDYYNNTGDYLYYLVRGYAVVGCAGLGTLGSEGLQLCGTFLETQAFAAVIGWLHGDRRAFTDRENNIEVRADWSNGRVGMTGISYLGTMAYEVAVTGVEGLEAVVPESGIASWYEYTNSQGASQRGDYDYTTYLSSLCASRFTDGVDDEHAYETYTRWLRYVHDAQLALKGSYGDYWASTEYSEAADIRVPALIVHGLNDGNVKTKQFDLMYKAFARSGANVKLLLHQGDHNEPGARWEDQMIGEWTFCELVDRWFSHYLAGVDNGVENIPGVMVQSNIDGTFYTYDSWDTASSLIMRPEESGETVVPGGGFFWLSGLLGEEEDGMNTPEKPAVWSMDVTEPFTVKGAVEIHLRLKTKDLSPENTNVRAYLVEASDEPFDTIMNDDGDRIWRDYIGTKQWALEDEDEVMATDIVRWLPTQVRHKTIASGLMSLKIPGAGYMPSTAVLPEEPAVSGEWYDYTMYLQPNCYTVQPGHQLMLFIVPELDGDYLYIEEEERMALDNSFTVDNSQSYAVIPVAEAE